MLVKLVELHKPQGDRVHLDEIYVSSSAVTTIRSENNSLMLEEAKQLGINSSASFSRITISEGGMTRTAVVVGSPAEIQAKLNKKMLLRD
tara:strand:+ start:389 stop:658 length:270 start_codon:yes stop_codon:yes gene_type:complete